jgi:ubiquinone biosynthesis accessory factor UbiK
MAMIDPKAFEDLAKRFTEALPPSFRQFQSDMEKNVQAALQAAFSKLELVTREEFDVQQSVLARTRAKLEELERQVAVLEAKIVAGGKRRKPAEKTADPDEEEH